MDAEPDRVATWIEDCDDNVGLCVWFGTPDYEDPESWTPLTEVAAAVWGFDGLDGPGAHAPGAAATDGRSVGPHLGVATLDTQQRLGCQVTVYENSQLSVQLPEAGFARLAPPWPYGDELHGEQLALVEAGDRWMIQFAQHVEASTGMTGRRDDEM